MPELKLSQAALARLRQLRLHSPGAERAVLLSRQQRRMSWTCHGSSNDEMVKKLHAARLFKDSKLVEAMRQVDRAAFVLDPMMAYQDSPQPIGYNATISAPHMHATCLELLKDQLAPGNKALDVGSGSGYLTCVFARLLGEGGRAVGIEHIPQLTERAQQAAGRIPWAAELMQAGALSFVTGNGMQGWSEGGPYHAIHVGASAAEVPPALLNQLAPGGRLLLPVGGAGERQSLTVIDKDAEGRLSGQEVLAVQYIPLTSREEQLGGLAQPEPAWSLLCAEQWPDSDD